MRSLWITVLSVILIGLTVGCTANVGQQLLIERDSLNATLSGVHIAHVSGALPTAQEAKLVPYLKATQASLDAGDAAWKSGDKSAASVYAKAAAAGLLKVAELYGPTTQPSH